MVVLAFDSDLISKYLDDVDEDEAAVSRGEQGTIYEGMVHPTSLEQVQRGENHLFDGMH